MSFPSCGCSATTYTVIRIDNFNRADGSIGTPSDSGSAWIADNGTFTITSNRLTSSSALGLTTLQTAASDVSVKVSVYGTNAQIAFRVVDTSNYLNCSFSSTQILVNKIIGGIQTNLLTMGSGGLVAGDILEVIANVDEINIRKNGVNLGSVYDTALMGATKHGLSSSSIGTWLYDDFSISSIS